MFELSTLVFEVLWEALELPPMPARIVVDQHGADSEERRRFVRRAEEEVRRGGWGTLREVKPQLAALLAVLAEHDRGLGWRELIGERRRAYLVERGEVAVQAIIAGERVRLARLRANHLVHALLYLLPEARPGSGRPVSVPTQTYQHAIQLAMEGKGAVEQRGLLRRAGVRPDQAEQLETVSRTTVNTGSISAYRGRRGQVKLAGSLAYTDTTAGRYLIVQRPDRAGVDYTSIVPADAKVLQRHVAEMLGTAAGW